MIQTLEVIQQHYVDQHLNSLVYKAVPTFYHQAPVQDDLYALFRLGANRIRCEISSTIDLQHRLPVSERRRRSLKKATKAGVTVVKGYEYLGGLWNVLSDNLQRKHGVAPVHSLAEIQLLAERFPQKIQCVCAEINGKIEAGVVLFVTPTTHHAQYIASSDAGYDTCALDAIFEYCISTARNDHSKWFDFGISTENSGMLLNSSLYKFKSEFGSGSFVHEFFEISLVV
jgi:lipid II:glycine glycyltransferase (peptidoglycan interpeptide bridge formation enzyme)